MFKPMIAVAMAVFVCSQAIYATEATEERTDLNSSDLPSESQKSDQDLTIMLQAVQFGHDQKVKIGDRVRTKPASKVLLTAIVTGGKPPYIYRWKKDGSDIADATEASLTISYVSIDDRGVYTVRATDSTGISVKSVVGIANRFDSWPPGQRSENSTSTKGELAFLLSVLFFSIIVVLGGIASFLRDLFSDGHPDGE
jgi:hypothetical protein